MNYGLQKHHLFYHPKMQFFYSGEKMPELDVSLSQVEPLGVDVFIKYTNNYAFSI